MVNPSAEKKSSRADAAVKANPSESSLELKAGRVFGAYANFRQEGGCIYLPVPSEKRTQMVAEGMRICNGRVLYDYSNPQGPLTKERVQASLASLTSDEVLVAYMKNYMISMDGMPAAVLLRSIEDFEFLKESGFSFIFVGKSSQASIGWKVKPEDKLPPIPALED